MPNKRKIAPNIILSDKSANKPKKNKANPKIFLNNGTSFK